MQYLARAVLIWVGLLTLTACNTINGVGKDIQKGGEAIVKSTR
ncbi:MAG: entericidin A/B family lipoprotein [Gammaproteobacteria bacterium]|nr:entericidin A/B family lipoprotein [Gammaproteobacteria bacterium]